MNFYDYEITIRCKIKYFSTTFKDTIRILNMDLHSHGPARVEYGTNKLYGIVLSESVLEDVLLPYNMPSSPEQELLFDLVTPELL